MNLATSILRHFAPLTIAWLLSASPADAQTADWHPPAVGTTFEWRLDGAETVTARVAAVTDFLVTEEANPGGRRARYFDFLVPETPSGEPGWIDAAQLKYFWPLEIGKTARFEFAAGTSLTVHTLTVSGYEQATTVPAGTFETFIIDWDERGEGDSRFAVHTRVWLAPALGTYVRFEREVTAGPAAGPATSGELIAVRAP